jgi:hypothetical protein
VVAGPNPPFAIFVERDNCRFTPPRIRKYGRAAIRCAPEPTPSAYPQRAVPVLEQSIDRVSSVGSFREADVNRVPHPFASFEPIEPSLGTHPYRHQSGLR